MNKVKPKWQQRKSKKQTNKTTHLPVTRRDAPSLKCGLVDASSFKVTNAPKLIAGDAIEHSQPTLV